MDTVSKKKAGCPRCGTKHWKRSDGSFPSKCTMCETPLMVQSKHAANRWNNLMKHANYVPPEAAQNSAKTGLKMVEDGEAGDGLESATVDRARLIAAGEPLTLEHVKRMHSFFERHDKTRPDDGGKGNSPWRTAWELWGGDSGRSWAESVVGREEGHDKSERLGKVAATRQYSILIGDEGLDFTFKPWGEGEEVYATAYGGYIQANVEVEGGYADVDGGSIYATPDKIVIDDDEAGSAEFVAPNIPEEISKALNDFVRDNDEIMERISDDANNEPDFLSDPDSLSY